MSFTVSSDSHVHAVLAASTPTPTPPLTTVGADTPISSSFADDISSRRGVAKDVAREVIAAAYDVARDVARDVVCEDNEALAGRDISEVLDGRDSSDSIEYEADSIAKCIIIDAYKPAYLEAFRVIMGRKADDVRNTDDARNAAVAAVAMVAKGVATNYPPHSAVAAAANAVVAFAAGGGARGGVA